MKGNTKLILTNEKKYKLWDISYFFCQNVTVQGVSGTGSLMLGSRFLVSYSLVYNSVNARYIICYLRYWGSFMIDFYNASPLSISLDLSL